MEKKALVFVFVLSFLWRSVSAQYEIIVSTDYPPYNHLNENGQLEGFNIDILNAIQKLYNVEFIIKGQDWETANNLLEEGKIQAIAGANYKGTPESQYYYTRSVIQTSHCFLYNRKIHGKMSSDEIRTLKQPQIVIWQNDVLIHYIKSINPNTRFIFVDNYKDLLNELERTDVTCAFSQRIASMYYATKMNKPYIQTGNEEVLERNMGFKISKDAPQLAEMLNNGLEVIMSNGEYQKIYNKWIKDYNNRREGWAHLRKYFILAGILVVTLILILLFFNYMLQARVKTRTRDLQLQLELNTRITKELEKQKFKAEESDKMKSAFLANMSHEIRTPMNGILGFTELLKSHDYSAEEQKQFIEIIQQSGERMLNTINNIIEISKIESGLESLHISETNIEKTVEELFLFFNLEAKKKGIGFFIEEKAIRTNQTFYSDNYKLNSILTNLIKNALKFTLKGHVKMGYTVSDELFSFYISDTGIGIKEEKQKAIFNHFVQAEPSISSRFEGSGLGLSICKEYTKMLDGKIRVESEINKGSTFFVDIPNHDGASPKKTETVLTKKNGKPVIRDGLKIIVAEDDPISFFFLKYILEGLSASVLHASNGLEAVELIKNNPDTDIILMDSRMPELNGIDAVKQIRKFNKSVYIIAQTAYAQDDYRAKTIEAGCNNYIEKPVNKNKLINIISKEFSKN